MNNEKIINLTDVADDDFEAIVGAIEDWKRSGWSGKFVFISEKDTQECTEMLREKFTEVFNQGVLRGGLVLAGGIALGAVLHYAGEYLKADKKKDVE